MNKRKNIADYDLFVGLEDKDLQARNRAVVIRNMYEDCQREDGAIGTADAALIASYFKEIPVEERRSVVDKLKEMGIDS